MAQDMMAKEAPEGMPQEAAPAPEGAAPEAGGKNDFTELVSFVGSALDAMKSALGEAGGQGAQVPPEALAKLEEISNSYNDFVASIGGSPNEAAVPEEGMMEEESKPEGMMAGKGDMMAGGKNKVKPMM